MQLVGSGPANCAAVRRASCSPLLLPPSSPPPPPGAQQTRRRFCATGGQQGSSRAQDWQLQPVRPHGPAAGAPWIPPLSGSWFAPSCGRCGAGWVGGSAPVWPFMSPCAPAVLRPSYARRMLQPSRMAVAQQHNPSADAQACHTSQTHRLPPPTNNRCRRCIPTCSVPTRMSAPRTPRPCRLVWRRQVGLICCVVEASDVLARHSMQAGCGMLQPTTASTPSATCHPAAAQALNAYADQLSQGLRPQAAKLTFYVRGGEGEALTEVGGQPVRRPCVLPDGSSPAPNAPGLVWMCAAQPVTLLYLSALAAADRRVNMWLPVPSPSDPCRAAGLRLPGPPVLRLRPHHPGGAEGGLRILRPG